MAVLRYPALVWRDAAGFHTAALLEADDEGLAGFGATADAALDRLRDGLEWHQRRGGFLPASDFLDPKLGVVKVKVRPEYHVGKLLHACDEVTLPVHCVSGRQASGLLVAALPLFGVRFTYHAAAALRNLVTRYVQQGLRPAEPRDVARCLPPPEVRLEEVVVRLRRPPRRVDLDAQWPALVQVAEPLGERAVRKQYAPAWERQEAVEEAVRKLHREGANLLLVGEQGVGKTTVLVEAVRTVERLHAEEAGRRDERPRQTRLFWLTSAGRLIAGMKYLGQWEERLEQVIDDLGRIPGVLCVDRLLDLARTGGHSSLAAFLMPYLQRGELRMAGEATPAELDACRRLLPGFADLFPVVQLPPFDRRRALAVLDRTAERHARNLRVEVAAGASDHIYHLFRRFAPYQAFPGAAAGFLRDLCQRQARTGRGQPVTADDVVNQFVRRTGLPRWLLRDEDMIDPENLLESLRSQVVGQEEATAAVARLVLTFKAGLNDPSRPVGVLLFCGPTGVGKTELARALAAVFFGHAGDDAGEAGRLTPRKRDDSRLVRLDMSEFAGPDAVDRLVGPPHGEPSAFIRRMRQQPFCVVLLDEIEKAGPEAFDVLLGVLDEGRLTDRFGRTTTFRSSVIVMTSNLGAGEAEAFGFGGTPASPYADAARAFFRPEFFNRLDAVVTFRPLGPETIRAITRKELEEIADREGFRRADLRLTWSERLVDRLARAGFDARHGARQLQRVLERLVVAPLARYLLARPHLRGTDVAVDCDERGEVRVKAAD